jgi:hypothetical protein
LVDQTGRIHHIGRVTGGLWFCKMRPAAGRCDTCCKREGWLSASWRSGFAMLWKSRCGFSEHVRSASAAVVLALTCIDSADKTRALNDRR